MYESYYGFSEKPFQLSPDPRFFFATNHHQRALSYLQYGLDQGEGFIVITGPIGTGKTTIARNLLSSIGDENIVAAQLVTTKLSPDELLELAAAEFKIPLKGSSKAEILRSIEAFLIQLHRQGKRALLLVDEAQNLPAETVEELRMLSNFQLDDKPLIQSFLLGQEELKDIKELDEQKLLFDVGLNPEKQFSILSSIQNAQQNANGARDLISSELYESINTLNRVVKNYNKDIFVKNGLFDFTTMITANVASLRTKIRGTLLHDEVYAIIMLGIYIERANQVIRIINSKYNDALVEKANSGISVTSSY